MKWVQLLVLSNLNILENRKFEILVWNRSESGMESGFLITTKPHLYPGCPSTQPKSYNIVTGCKHRTVLVRFCFQDRTNTVRCLHPVTMFNFLVVYSLAAYILRVLAPRDYTRVRNYIEPELFFITHTHTHTHTDTCTHKHTCTQTHAHTLQLRGTCLDLELSVVNRTPIAPRHLFKFSKRAY